MTDLKGVGTGEDYFFAIVIDAGQDMAKGYGFLHCLNGPFTRVDYGVEAKAVIGV